MMEFMELKLSAQEVRINSNIVKSKDSLSEQLDAVVKSGAAGVLCVGLRSGASVVVKISDGATRAAYPVALWALEATGHLPSEQVQQLLPQVTRPVIGGVQDNAPREVGGWVPGADLEPLVGESA